MGYSTIQYQWGSRQLLALNLNVCKVCREVVRREASSEQSRVRVRLSSSTTSRSCYCVCKVASGAGTIRESGYSSGRMEIKRPARNTRFRVVYGMHTTSKIITYVHLTRAHRRSRPDTDYVSTYIRVIFTVGFCGGGGREPFEFQERS